MRRANAQTSAATNAPAGVRGDERSKDEVVSFDDEPLLLVNSADEVIGVRNKAECHNGDGLLHRAFSLFVFNQQGELLMQQRAAGKRLWPMFWSNSCCSHPRQGEEMGEAVHRRLAQELSLDVTLEFLFKFEYQARFSDAGSEHELCWVWVGHTTAEPVANTEEVNDWRWVAPATLDQALGATPEHYTPWFRMEWQRLRNDFGDKLLPAGG